MIFFAPRWRITMPPENLSVTIGDREVPVSCAAIPKRRG